MRQMLSSFPFLDLFLFFFIFTSTFHAVTSTDLIRETCKKCAGRDPNLSYNFCVTSLQAAPKSHCADDLRDLGMVSIRLVRRNLTNTRSYVEELLKNKKLVDPFVRSCLHDCFNLYSDAIPSTKEAIKDYKSQHYDDANIDVSAVMDAATTCEDGFKEKEGVVSPLTKRNNNTFQLSAISISIVNMLRMN
ncbi:PREDICTED: putative invertase inhibitor [Theobroma cacao]|uniref:Invertase inhibitor n=1 Tax=Theobroma cacao TaxID=3641 RepID=A0AB32VTD6_THECC|nr:PREDICTED: putative invertase inhibitor [Theobroma cacao]